MIQCPYPGLRPFEPEDAELFFGRDEQIEQLLDRLADTRFISVVGLSGCGKSSLVNAGMMPALESGLLPNASFRWQTVRMRPGNQPLHNLAEALQPILAADSDQAGSDLRFLLASLRRGPFSLIEIFQEAPLPKHTNLLLVVDQFEELFRYHHEGGKEETEAFVKLLLASVKQDEIPIYIVTTMRSEFIGECALFYDLPEMMNAGQFLAPRLTRDQQREAIEEPARFFGRTIEPRLVNTLLNEMGADPDQLPLLQHCLMRMWFHAQKKPEAETDNNKAKQAPTDGVNLSIKEYESVGGLQDALSRHADEAYNELNEKQQKIVEIMFRCLTEGDRRRPVAVYEIAKVAQVPADEIEEVTKVFRRPDRCFLRPYGNEHLKHKNVLDISHESLIRQWKQLNEWVKTETKLAENYCDLEKNAVLWKEGRRSLWQPPELDIALDWWVKEQPNLEWANRYGRHFDLAQRYLEKSLQAEEEWQQQQEHQQQERFRRARRRFIWSTVGLITAIIFVWWSFQQIRCSTKQN